jgi:hypothetical protein
MAAKDNNKPETADATEEKPTAEEALIKGEPVSREEEVKTITVGGTDIRVSTPAKLKPVPPLKTNALVRFKRPFRLGLQTFPVTRFGVMVPAGTVLPRDAVILKEKVKEAPEYQETKVEDLSPEGAPESKQVVADNPAQSANVQVGSGPKLNV